MARPRTPKIPKPPRIETLPEGVLTYKDLPQDFLDSFRKNITCSVAFVKDDGSVRTMAFRKRLLSYNELRSTDPKSEKESNILPNNNMFRGYDINLYKKNLKETNGDSAKAASKSYRFFRLDTVLALMWGGEGFKDYREQNQIMKRFGPQVYNQLPENMTKRKLKTDIQSAESESGETLQENFKNMKKKINLNQFKNLVKRIIKEEKNNLTTRKNKVVRITESQLRNQVRKMLREYDDGYNYDPDELDYGPQGQSVRYTDDEFELPSGEGFLLDWRGAEDTSGDEDHYFEITKAIYYPNYDSEEHYEINIYDPKYKRQLDELTKLIYKSLDDEFGSSYDPNQGIERWN